MSNPHRPEAARPPTSSSGPWTRLTATTLLLVASTSATNAQEPDSTSSPPFASYSVIQYATTDGPAPQNILRLDNNGEIVLAARKGIPREELATAAGPFAESQIVLLETFRLLEEHNDTLRTTFPILNSEETRQLRQRTQSVAPSLADLLAPSIRTLVQELQATGRERTAYTILFSYVLDGLVWDEFEERSLVAVREITAEKPLWSGETWALHPPRAFASGTNSISEEGVSLKVNWTGDAIPHMLPFVADIPTLLQMFNDYRTEGVVAHQRVREVFGPFDLFDEEGRFTIPVIVEDDSNSLYRSARAIAEKVAAEAPARLNVPSFAEELGFRDARQALVVAYHELMWDVIDHLDAEGLVRKPAAFAEPDRAAPSDIADLVFIVRASR